VSEKSSPLKLFAIFSL